ncbi:hypothetical protein CKO42_24910 [Lamprobacter modestohalophilus]|uniref:Transposase (putative) YhgA-like domain-containing protein n=1 Tax=Lamprobacter modestohalophilus TaxID=1064514 RepID=A0A9X1B6G3_9GAMM|nr:hypothetical protein [Lamprobacter modestohalophilus]MCF7977362.1 Rpn family recombination-promoting nuclease/putative transposase [Chromatiaceae bacterium]
MRDPDLIAAYSQAALFYHGQSFWRMPSDFHALIRPLPEALKPYVPQQFGYALHDLSPRSDAEIKGDVLTRLVQLALRWRSSATSRSSICSG